MVTEDALGLRAELLDFAPASRVAHVALEGDADATGVGTLLTEQRVEDVRQHKQFALRIDVRAATTLREPRAADFTGAMPRLDVHEARRAEDRPRLLVRHEHRALIGPEELLLRPAGERPEGP